MTRSAGGKSSSGPMAAILSPLMATAASKTSEAVTILPPRTTVSTRGGPLIGFGLLWSTSVGGRASSRKRSSVRLLLRHGLKERGVVLGLAAPEEVPALAHGGHLVKIDARDDQLIARGGGLGQHLAHGIDDAGAADQLHAVLHAGLGDADHEARVGVGAGAQAELVEIEGEGGDGGVVAVQDDLGALEGERAIALGVPAVLAHRDTHLGAAGVEDLVARVAVGEVVGLVDLGEAVRGLGAGKVDLPESPDDPAVAVGQERGVEVLAVGLLAEADVDGDPGLLGAAKEGLEGLGRDLRLEELIEVLADLLGEIRRERHLGIGDELDALGFGLIEQREHALDDFLPAAALLVGTQLGGGDGDDASHELSPLRGSQQPTRSRRAWRPLRGPTASSPAREPRTPPSSA